MSTYLYEHVLSTLMLKKNGNKTDAELCFILSISNNHTQKYELMEEKATLLIPLTYISHKILLFLYLIIYIL